jgi:hypothetical protein
MFKVGAGVSFTLGALYSKFLNFFTAQPVRIQPKQIKIRKYLKDISKVFESKFAPYRSRRLLFTMK